MFNRPHSLSSSSVSVRFSHNQLMLKCMFYLVWFLNWLWVICLNAIRSKIFWGKLSPFGHKTISFIKTKPQFWCLFWNWKQVHFFRWFSLSREWGFQSLGASTISSTTRDYHDLKKKSTLKSYPRPRLKIFLFKIIFSSTQFAFGKFDSLFKISTKCLEFSKP